MDSSEWKGVQEEEEEEEEDDDDDREDLRANKKEKEARTIRPGSPKGKRPSHFR